MQVYEGVHALAQRQFDRAAARFLDAVATFTAAELFPFERCVWYAIVAAIITLPRPELKKKVRRNMCTQQLGGSARAGCART